MVARLGGDEFVILLEDIKQVGDTSNEAKNIIETVNHVVQVEDYQLNVACSIGISIFPLNGATTLDLLNAADVAMYAAKAAGRNRFYYFGSGKL